MFVREASNKKVDLVNVVGPTVMIIPLTSLATSPDCDAVEGEGPGSQGRGMWSSGSLRRTIYQISLPSQQTIQNKEIWTLFGMDITSIVFQVIPL